MDKLAKLIAVFDQFNDCLAVLDDAAAQELSTNWSGIRDQYARPGSIPRSALASGMEQGLREIPTLLESLGPRDRKRASDALESALAAHYPSFLAKDAKRLEKIRTRGFIRGEAEYYLVRHQIDMLEGEASQKDQLQKYYEMVDRFETRRI